MIVKELKEFIFERLYRLTEFDKRHYSLMHQKRKKGCYSLQLN